MANKQSNKKETTKLRSSKPKPYIHIDTFLQTAIQLYGLSRVQVAGFKAHMEGKHYQQDEMVFVKELKAYFNLT